MSGEHQIQTLRFVGHLRPWWTIEPRPKWPMGGHLSLTQMAIGHLRCQSFESNAMCTHSVQTSYIFIKLKQKAVTI